MGEKKLFTKGRMDFPLFITVALICAFGLVMVFSASYYYAQTRHLDGYYYLKNQAMYMAVGFVAMLLISRLDYHRFDDMRVVALVITLLLMAAVIVFGVERNGAKRWLQLGGEGGFSFQPAELAKFTLVLYMSSFMARRQNYMKSFKLGVMPMLLIIGIMSLFVILQKNLSMMIIVVMTGGVMLYLGGARFSHLLILIGAAVPVLFALAYFETYRWNRMMIFMDPWKDPLKTGYQLIQSLYALGSGGLFGKGLNFSRQKLLFLTYGESDFIFAIIGEELGLIGCYVVMLAYLFVIYRGIMIAVRCKDRFGSLFAAGITSVLAMQVAVNIGVATSSVPPTGQTLPFISAGGTSLAIFLAAIGILLNISRNTEIT